MYVPDNYDVLLSHEEAEEQRKRGRPVCETCGERIADAFCYGVDGKVICEGCMEREHRIWTEDLKEV